MTKLAELEHGILIEDSEKSYHASFQAGENDIFDNRLIFGDNLLALKALEQEFAGKIKCIYIDPPYNIHKKWKHYSDSKTSSDWIEMMSERLKLMVPLLSDSGSLWISIDDHECHYLKVIIDEIFGRQNFISSVIWEKKYSRQNDAKFFSTNHDYILVYAKNIKKIKLNLPPRTEKMDSRYKNQDSDSRGCWSSGSLLVKTYSPKCDYPITNPKGRVINPPNGSCWRVSKEKFEELKADNRIWFGKDGGNVPTIKRFLSELKKQGVTPITIWPYTEVGHNQDSKREAIALNNKNVFDTPKPEKLIQRILTLSTNQNDLVLDCFAGSGTTGAVAHKMYRKWIMVENGEHLHTHIIPRLKKVIDGEDKIGITKPVDWKSGGGFRYYGLRNTKRTMESNHE